MIILRKIDFEAINEYVPKTGKYIPVIHQHTVIVQADGNDDSNNNAVIPTAQTIKKNSFSTYVDGFYINNCGDEITAPRINDAPAR